MSKTNEENVLNFDIKQKLVSVREALKILSTELNQNIDLLNLNFYFKYGFLNKYEKDGLLYVDLDELNRFIKNRLNEKINKLNKLNPNQEKRYTEDELKDDFFKVYSYSTRITQKHVNGLIPYKGKYIPQLVEYFLDSKIRLFKDKVYFNKGDIVIDIFCGSGTTLVQANELGIDAIGVEISNFSHLLSNVKIRKYDIDKLYKTFQYLNDKYLNFFSSRNNDVFDAILSEELNHFNNRNFNSDAFKYVVLNKGIDEQLYSSEKTEEFCDIYNRLKMRFNLNPEQKGTGSFLDTWYVTPVKEELLFLADEIKKIKDPYIRDFFILLLSKTARSCRTTPHVDKTLLNKHVVTKPYYCKLHFKICKPVYSIFKFWNRYFEDMIGRIKEFDRIRTDTNQVCVLGDSRDVNIYEELKKINPDFAEKLKNQKAKGVFSSPPYLGIIDYHDQHSYAFELFDLPRKDDLEIGPMFRGKGKVQKENYVNDMAMALNNVKKYLADDYDIFLVANDGFNLYPRIADLAGMKIVNSIDRIVTNRSELYRASNDYYETIFHLKEK